jgi:hypothetical protein
MPTEPHPEALAADRASSCAAHNGLGQAVIKEGADDAVAVASTMATKVVLCVTGSVAGIKVGELMWLLEAAGATCRVAASSKGAIFLNHSQQEMPGDVVVCGDKDDDREVYIPKHCISAALVSACWANASMGLPNCCISALAT